MNRNPKGPPDGFVPVGRVGKAHGLKGRFRLQADGLNVERLAPGDPVWLDGLGEAVIETWEPRASFAVVQVDRVRDADHARMLLHHSVYAVVADEDVQPDPEGMPVILNGQPFGEIVRLLGSDASPLVEVDTETVGRILVPAVAPYVHWRPDGLHLEDPPEGLLPS